MPAADPGAAEPGWLAAAALPHDRRMGEQVRGRAAGQRIAWAGLPTGGPRVRRGVAGLRRSSSAAHPARRLLPGVAARLAVRRRERRVRQGLRYVAEPGLATAAPGRDPGPPPRPRRRCPGRGCWRRTTTGTGWRCFSRTSTAGTRRCRGTDRGRRAATTAALSRVAAVDRDDVGLRHVRARRRRLLTGWDAVAAEPAGRQLLSLLAPPAGDARPAGPRPGGHGRRWRWCHWDARSDNVLLRDGEAVLRRLGVGAPRAPRGWTTLLLVGGLRHPGRAGPGRVPALDGGDRR